MALSGSVITNSYEQRYYKVEWWASQSIPNNQSVINYLITAEGAGWWAERTLEVVIAGSTVLSKTDRVERWDGTIKSGSVTVNHAVNGSMQFDISIRAAVYYSSVNLTGSSSFTLDPIPRKASLTSAPDFTDEENPTIYYDNPAGNAVQVQACISLTGETDDVIYRNLEPYGTSYTFDLNKPIPERNNKTGHEILREATTSGKQYRFVTFFVTTIIGDSIYYSTLQRTYTVINCAPDLNPTVIDEGESSYKLTNDRSKLIQYFNYPKVTFNATAKKGASIINQTVICGSQTKVTEGEYVQFNNVDSNVFTVSVTDNRGVTVVKEITMDMIPYVNLTCNTYIEKELGTDHTNSTIYLVAEGEYYMDSFGAVDNNLIVEYRYKSSTTDYPVDENGNEIWSSEWNDGFVISNNKYQHCAYIENIDYTKTYTIQVRAKDSIYTGGVQAKDEIVKIVPVFDWSENDFNFNVPVTIQGKNALRSNDANRICRAFTQETDIQYTANSYIKLFRDGSPTD